jgi:hypothetical protein
VDAVGVMADDFFVPDEPADEVRAAFERAAKRGVTRVPTNAELAKRAKDKELVTIVRDWLRRHVRPPADISPEDDIIQRLGVEVWLDWAANNFVADPEIAASLTISHQHAYQRGYEDGHRAEGKS